MSDIKLTYFDFAGSRGEEIRLALAIAGVAFEDNRVTHDAFGALKPDLPFGALPVLEVKGHAPLAQSNAILRLIGRQHGMHPEEPFEAARHDAFMEAAEELRQRISATMRMADAVQKKAARQQLSTDYLPQWGGCVDRMIGDGPFVGGEKASVADIKLYMVDRWISRGGIDDVPATIFDPFTRLKTVAAGIADHGAVRGWYAASGQ